MFALMVIIVGIAGMSINLSKDRSGQWAAQTSFIVKTSIGAHGALEKYYDREPVHVMESLNLIFIFVIIVGGLVLTYLQNKVVSDIDEKNLTPSDYGVMATNLPLNKTQEEVEEWLKTFFSDLEIVYVNYCYDIKDIVALVRRLSQLQQIKSYLVAYKKKKLKDEGVNEQEAEAKEINLTPPPKRTCCF